MVAIAEGRGVVVDLGVGAMWVAAIAGAVGAVWAGPLRDRKRARLATVAFVGALLFAIALPWIGPLTDWGLVGEAWRGDLAPWTARSLCVWGLPIAIGAVGLAGWASAPRWGMHLLLGIGALFAWNLGGGSVPIEIGASGLAAELSYPSSPEGTLGVAVVRALFVIGMGALLAAVAVGWCAGWSAEGSGVEARRMIRRCGVVGLVGVEVALAIDARGVGGGWVWGPFLVAANAFVALAWIGARIDARIGAGDRWMPAVSVAALGCVAGFLWAMGNDLFAHDFCGFICSRCAAIGRFVVLPIGWGVAGIGGVVWRSIAAR